MKVMAQTPEPSGQWTFSDPNDLMKASKGNLVLTPAVMGDHSITEATVAEAGITTAEGMDGISAIFVPKAAALKVARAEGAEATSNYTILMDMMLPDAYAYDGLLQTNAQNNNDGEVFVSKHQIGINALGGYYGGIRGELWYRIVMTYSDGTFKVYVNGEKLMDSDKVTSRWEIDPWGFYLHCDEDGEMSDAYIGEVAFWETPLTDEQVAAMGSVCPNPWITSVSQIQEGEQFFLISDRIAFKGSTSGKPKAMSTLQSNYSVNWGEKYVYWGDLNINADGFIWTAEKVGDQWAFLNKENSQYLGNMNEGEADVIFSTTPVGYTLTDLNEGEGCFYMTNDESEYSLHVQGYLRSDRGNNSISKQNVGNDDYSDDVATAGYPGRWRLVKVIGETPEENVKKIATAEDFVAFAEAINSGKQIDGVLTDNIDLGETLVMVGVNGAPFTGTFDGQGHSITYNFKTVGDYGGLFGFVDGATICNMYVKGSAVVQGIHFGALMGYVSGTVLVENVVTNVDIAGDRSGVTGDGGMIGRLEGTVTFNNCGTLGSMGNKGTSMYCGFVAFAGNGSSVLNNCYTACSLTEGTGTDYCFTFCRGTMQLNNCYYLNAIGEVQGKLITEDQLASGELCYALNGDQSAINWTQDLGTDPTPKPNPHGPQVYAQGTVRCDGAEIPDSPITYSNTKGEITKPDHQYGEDGFCTVCGSVRQDKDGCYLIGNVSQFSWLVNKVSEGGTDCNVLLTADIDLTEAGNLMIGTEANEYAGIFDGQGHTITYNYEVKDKWRGLFAFVNGATIRNLKVEGSAYVTQIHYGALIGRAYGPVLVENVITNVDITGAMKQVTGDGGMLGANYANITFNNCATLGKMGYEGSSMYSSFSAWSNGSSSTTLNNCYSLCELTEGTGTGNCFTLTHQSGTNTLNNCYYLNVIGKVIDGDQTQVTAAEVANGALCAKLGEGWYQNIGEDAYPVLDKTHGIVKEISEAGYATMYIPEAVDAPEGVEVYTGSVNEDKLVLNPIEGTIPAYEPVVLKGAAGFYSFKPAAGVEKSVTVDFSAMGYENAQELSTITADDVDIMFDLGSGTTTPKYYNTGNAARLYGGNTLSVYALGQPITKIEFTFSSNAPTAADAVFNTGEFDFETYTWTGNAETVTLTRNATSGHYRISKMTVTYAGQLDNIEGNDLKGTAEDIEAAGKYVLAKPEGKPVGFYLADKGTIKAGKAYLENDSNTGPLVKAFYFTEEDATGIENVNYNDNQEVIYDLNGRRVSKAQKGIYIINGKKVLK